ncbi:MAG: restriction endonuclease [Rhizobiaceae bacterium]
MSSLRSIDLAVVADLMDFIRGPGYVLDFSDSSFSQFFADLDVDIESPCYSDNGSSKGKRLRRYLQLVDDDAACNALSALWDHRKDWLVRTGQDDPVQNSEARYLTLMNRLGGGPAGGSPQEPPKPAFNFARLDELKTQLVGLSSIAPHPRGYAFETFLRDIFAAYHLEPREPFRNRGEQIDGSFLLGSETYLLEAKWENRPIGQAELLVFEGKLGSKAAWARGLFVSYNGFTQEGLEAFGRGKRTICMNGHDMFDMLDRRIPFDHVIDRKARRAVETGWPFVPLRELF